ncbi:DUF305 domain-containing protein [Amycolatopsis anabasis]|uniref:DUF305 domain-containing protein n=1 Tax=Amycolatopsis anabasis TaxID=1840409 RepID=UPI00131CA98E|nr:DUF305 domain-containing protein [Amycolatopsis anabasis]
MPLTTSFAFQESIMFRFHRRLAFAVVVSALALTGCSGGPDPAPSAAPPAPEQFNEADVHFANKMIPHLQQSLDMAALADTRAGNERLKALARRIQDVHEPEIARLSGLLESWGQPAPEDPGLHAAEQAGLSGMLTGPDMAGLQAASGAAFDQSFADLMIRHHEGALNLAGQASSAGVNPQSRALAEQISQAQRAEIDELRALKAG